MLEGLTGSRERLPACCRSAATDHHTLHKRSSGWTKQGLSCQSNDGYKLLFALCAGECPAPRPFAGFIGIADGNCRFDVPDTESGLVQLWRWRVKPSVSQKQAGFHTLSIGLSEQQYRNLARANHCCCCGAYDQVADS